MKLFTEEIKHMYAKSVERGSHKGVNCQTILGYTLGRLHTIVISVESISK